MNDRMYGDAATQANLETLRERGVTVIEPDEGPSLRAASTASAGSEPEALLAESRPRSRRRPDLGRAAGPGHRRRDP